MALFTARVKNSSVFAQIEKGIVKDIEAILSSREMLSEVGEFVVERIRFQARTEKPFNSSKSLPLLRESTIRHREYLARYNKTHAVFDSGLSNLTVTGAFQDSLTFRVKGTGLLELYFLGKHPRYRGKSGEIGKEVKNSDLFKWLSDKGFKLFDESIEENKTIKSRVRSIVQRFIRRGLAVRNRLRA